MALLTGLLVAVGGFFGGSHGAAIMLVISLGMNFFSYWFSDSIVLRAYDAREIDESQAPELYRLVQGLAANAELPMPKVCIMRSHSGMSTGKNSFPTTVAKNTKMMKS